jgi:hypothetical protein
VKNDNAGRMTARTIEELKGGISKAIDRLRALPELVCGFFKGPDLAYFKRPASKSADQISRSSVGRQDGCGHTPTNAASWGWVVTRVFGAFLLISHGLLV